MGWFDEDDDEDEEGRKQQQRRRDNLLLLQQQQSLLVADVPPKQGANDDDNDGIDPATSGGKPKDDEEEDDDDPLDAYMKSLNPQAAKVSAAVRSMNDEGASASAGAYGVSSKSRCRLDLEQEEEEAEYEKFYDDEYSMAAVAPFSLAQQQQQQRQQMVKFQTIDPKSSSSSSNNNNNNNNNQHVYGNENLGGASSSSASSLQFVAAGASASAAASGTASASVSSEYNPLHAHFVLAGEKRPRKQLQLQQQQQQQQPSLESNNSKNTDTAAAIKLQQEQQQRQQQQLLDASQRAFWAPTDTSQGHQWRAQHAVTCQRSSSSSSSHNDQRGVGSGRGGGGGPRKHNNNNNSSSSSSTIDPIFHMEELRDVLGPTLLNKLYDLGYTQPTLVQAQTLSVALSGHDAVITAATGQGKTLAYTWPMVVHVAHQPPLQGRGCSGEETGPLGLVLVPTRELAQQVNQQITPMIQAATAAVGGVGSSNSGHQQYHNSGRKKHHGTPCRAVIGGQGKYLLRQEIKRSGGVLIVVATPGRLLDVVSDNKGLSLKRTTFVVLDEADKLLQMGFEQQVRQILSQIPTRQTLLLSATMSRRVEQVANEWLLSSGGDDNNYCFRISVGRTGEASENVTQKVVVLPSELAKQRFLFQQLLPSLTAGSRTLIFCSTRQGCETLAQELRSANITQQQQQQQQEQNQEPSSSAAAASTATPVVVTCDTLHGDKHQMDRTQALKAFSKGKTPVLVATDVAARGLDVPQVETVIQFDPPKNLDSHVHRIGRAGRLDVNTQQSQRGIAYSLLVDDSGSHRGGSSGSNNCHPKDADFAFVLRNAWERKGLPIPLDLERLALKCRKAGNVHSHARSKINPAGLGFDPRDQSYEQQQQQQQQNALSAYQPQHHHHHQQQTQQEQHHYGPGSESNNNSWLPSSSQRTASTEASLLPPPPPPKRSRWGP